MPSTLFRHAGPWLAVLVLLCTTLQAAERVAPDEELIDRIVAIAGDSPITARDLDARLRLVTNTLREKGAALPPPEVLRRQVLERLILERLQLEQAKRRGIRIDDGTLNEVLRGLAKQNGMTVEELRDSLLAKGVDWEQFREQLRTELTIEKLRTRVIGRRIQVTDREIDEFLRQRGAVLQSDMAYRVRHILVAVPEGASAEQIQAAKQRAEDIRKRALAGEDFAQLAIRESEGMLALEGGDLGWRKAEDLPTLFADRVPKMKPGEISEVFRSPSGFHIIKLEDRRGTTKAVVRQTHARHILVKPKPGETDAEVRERLASLRRRIQAGEDFAELAKAHSEDTGSAVRGGDLGWLSPGSTVPEFEEVMDRLRPGELSEPFKSPFGWHLVQVLDRRDVDNSQEAIRERVREILGNRKLEEETELWLRRLRDQSFVEIVDPELIVEDF
ncbi:MAG TPA: molecular chaperone SurA [Chromatiales bacterium]|nr:molecular chaperone SurA [Chromatiales bacterium]